MPAADKTHFGNLMFPISRCAERGFTGNYNVAAARPVGPTLGDFSIDPPPRLGLNATLAPYDVEPLALKRGARNLETR